MDTTPYIPLYDSIIMGIEELKIRLSKIKDKIDNTDEQIELEKESIRERNKRSVETSG